MMTPEQQQQACREVAEAQGYRWYSLSSAYGPMRFLEHPDVVAEEFDMNHPEGPKECNDLSIRIYTDYYTRVPDLFATNKAGAYAREQAEEWLLPWCKKNGFTGGWWVIERPEGNRWVYYFGKIESDMALSCNSAVGGGATLAEARANAIIAAVRAMKG